MERSRTEIASLASVVLRGTTPEEAVTLAWPLVCGQRVSGCTKAVAFADHDLVVEVPDRGWRTQLSEYAPHYMHQLKQITGIDVRHIRFALRSELMR